MLTFLRKIRRSLVESGNAGKYLIYALGEVALIIVGILIALFISNWSSNRKLRKMEFENLALVAKSLKEDINQIEGIEKGGKRYIHRLDILDSLFTSPDPVYQPYMDTLFGAIWGSPTLEINRGPYEGLKNFGLNNVTNDSIRQGLINLYETMYSSSVTSNAWMKQASTNIWGHAIVSFQNIGFGQLTPIDKKAIWKNIVIKNLIDYQRFSLSNHVLNNFAGVRDEMIILLDQINRYLEEKDAGISKKLKD